MSTERQYLVIRLSALGDVVLTEPVARAIRSMIPGARVDLLTDAAMASVMRTWTQYRHVFGYDHHGTERGHAGLLACAARVTKTCGTYTGIIDLQGKLRTRWIARSIDAENRWTLKKRSWGRALLSLGGYDPPILDRHSVDLYLDALTPLGIHATHSNLAGFDRAPRFMGAHPARASSIARPEDEGHPRIGLGLDARHATKRWPIEKFGLFCEALRREFPGARFFPVAGPNSAVLIDDLAKHTDAGAFTSIAAPRLSLDEIVTELAKLDLYVGCDSGPAHVAAALGVKVIVLFGPTSPTRWGPIGVQHQTVHLGLPCSPCSNVGNARCPSAQYRHACMKDLLPELVVDAARIALSK